MNSSRVSECALDINFAAIDPLDAWVVDDAIEARPNGTSIYIALADVGLAYDSSHFRGSFLKKILDKVQTVYMPSCSGDMIPAKLMKQADLINPARGLFEKPKASDSDEVSVVLIEIPFTKNGGPNWEKMVINLGLVRRPIKLGYSDANRLLEFTGIYWKQ